MVPHGSSKPVKITRVSCSGSEKRLIDCPHQPFHGPPSTAEDVIITCIINSSPTVSTAVHTTNLYNTSVPSTPHATVAVEKDVSTHDDSSPSEIYIAATTVPTVLVSCGAIICAILCYRKRRMKRYVTVCIYVGARKS